MRRVVLVDAHVGDAGHWHREGPAAEAEIPDWGRIVGVGGVAVQDKEGIVAQLRALTSEKQRIEGQATGWLHQGARLTSVQ